MASHERSPTQSPSPADMSDDAYNLDTARVHFGPFKTPEKRLAALVAESERIPVPNGAASSIRSPSISPPASSTETDEQVNVGQLADLDDEDSGASNPDPPTPTNEVQDDEPSSALASRLLRAIGNPSPPPSPTALPLLDDTEPVAIDETEDAELAREASTIAISPISFPIVIKSPTNHSTNNSEPDDLMTFDLLDEQLEKANLSLTLPRDDSFLPPSPLLFPNTTVPSSHQPSSSEAYSGQTGILVDIQDEAPEQIQLSNLIEHSSSEPATENISNTKVSGSENENQSSPKLPLLENTLAISFPSAVTEEPPQTPLRRSTRPRKSTTPYLLELLASSSPKKDQSSPVSNSITRKSRKGKERAASPLKSAVFGENENSTTPVTVEVSESKSQRRHSKSPIRQELGRELGSLSPNSTDILARLLPSTSSVTQEPASIDDIPIQDSAPVTPPVITNPQETIDNAKSINQPSLNANTSMSSPVRLPTTPRRPTTPHSPSKLRLQPISLDDPTRTPAQRVQLSQAFADGYISPQKISQMQMGVSSSTSIFTGKPIPVLNTALKGNLSPSPARRNILPSTTSLSSKASSAQIFSPMKSLTRSDTSETVPGDVGGSRTASRPAKLPFPLTSVSMPLPRAEEQPIKGSSSSLPPDSPEKSSLKQVNSRIPRKKPYSRPTVIPVITKKTAVVAKPTTGRSIGNTTQSSQDASTSKKPVTNLRVAKGIPPVSTTATTNVRVIRAMDLSKLTATATSTVLVGEGTSTLPVVTGDNVTTMTGNLKRKRLDSKPSSVPGSRPAVMMRQIPTAASSSLTKPTVSPSLRSAKLASTSSNLVQKPSGMKIRRVMSTEVRVPPNEIVEGSSQLPQSTVMIPTENIGTDTPEKGSEFLLESEDIVLSSPTTEFETQATSSSPLAPQTNVVTDTDISIPVVPSEKTEKVETTETTQPTNGRRITRRNSAQSQSTNDIESINDASNRLSQRRRSNARNKSNTDDVFMGMGITALKHITTDNTTRNQHYIAAKLETEIVRKEGPRPESPAVKVKTVTQRQQEEKTIQREERAARRARTHGSMDNTSDDDGEGDEDDGYESPSPMNGLGVESPFVKHRRGAGDEDDYETPAKKIGDDKHGKRRVKWDKGLFTEVFLDEVVLGERMLPPKENIVKKGCLAPTAKTLRLDTLGNLVDCEAPLADLIQEHVVVKKFIYDDEVEAVVEKPVTPAPRNTRKKKGKR